MPPYTQSAYNFEMWVIYLEAFVVVTMVLLIVWWTMKGK
jgi:hypothetical protein